MLRPGKGERGLDWVKGSDEGEEEDGVSSVKETVRKELKHKSLIWGPAVNILPRAVNRKQSLRSAPERISIREGCNEGTGEKKNGCCEFINPDQPRIDDIAADVSSPDSIARLD